MSIYENTTWQKKERYAENVQESSIRLTPA